MPIKDNISGSDYNQWYQSVYPQLTNSGTWLRGGELNTLSKNEYDSRNFRILFARLSTYKDVSASFTHLLLYQIACGIPGVFADLAYLPPVNDTKIFETSGIPWLLGTQTKFGPRKFDLIGFSNSIVQEIINIPNFLKTSQIPLSASKRLDDERVPIIILGGANAPYTTSIWGPDSLVDGVFTGHDSSCIARLFEICSAGKKENRPKRDILVKCWMSRGFYLPIIPRNPASARN